MPRYKVKPRLEDKVSENLAGFITKKRTKIAFVRFQPYSLSAIAVPAAAAPTVPAAAIAVSTARTASSASAAT
jgi:hypothetical protein